jgi:hypothetical protein
VSAFAAVAPGGAPAAPIMPYVYGATLGRPSRARPENVLKHLKKIDEARQERFVADGREGRAAVKGSLPRSPRNGFPAGRFYVYKGVGEDTLTGHLPHGVVEFEAAEAMGAGVIAAADAERLAALERELAARGVVAAEDGAGS